MEGENICAQGFFSFAQGEKNFVKNEGEIVRVRNTLHLGSEPLLAYYYNSKKWDRKKEQTLLI